MIGLVTKPGQEGIAAEFFELFKTPWEFAVSARRYEVVISTAGQPHGLAAGLFLVFDSRRVALDELVGASVVEFEAPRDVEGPGGRVPLFGRALGFVGCETRGFLVRGSTPLDYWYGEGETLTLRVGFDLFAEVEFLLTVGQPASEAATPTLEHHIEFVRRAMLQAGQAFVEVPAKPAGSDFVCCLTHDVDFFGIRRHRFDRTMAGFAARASVGSLVDLLRGRRSASEVARNLLALATLPLVHAGVLEDYWQPLRDYARADGPRPSTFFVVPFGGRPGASGPAGPVPHHRAVPYGAADVAALLREALVGGREIAVHGIDAWCSTDAGRTERAEVERASKAEAKGVRMHWLFYDPGTPHRLEQAGYSYDSTWGYNDAVGYRAGTSQAFVLPGTEGLVELPLTIMDTALFYPDRMGLNPDEALRRCRALVDEARSWGGSVVVNWHDRSLAPERLWRRPYRALLELLDGAWFATASQAVAWYRWRRSISFETVSGEVGLVVTVPVAQEGLPGACVRWHRPGAPVVEEALHGGTSLKVAA